MRRKAVLFAAVFVIALFAVETAPASADMTCSPGFETYDADHIPWCIPDSRSSQCEYCTVTDCAPHCVQYKNP
jgi:hypothetical protein